MPSNLAPEPGTAGRSKPPARGAFALLGACGAIIAAGAAAVAALGDVRQGNVSARVWQFIAVFAVQFLAFLGALIAVRMLARRKADRAPVLLLALAVAAAARLVLALLSWPNLSDDVHRYVWDGKAQQVGINPYLVKPDEAPPSLLASPEGRAATHGHIPAVYPPVTELTFRLIYPVARTARGYRAALLLFDVGTLGILAALLRSMGRSRLWVVAYAWHPLVLNEFGAGGHFDSVGIFWMVAAVYLLRRRRGLWAYAALGLAVLTKYLAAPLAVFFWPRTRKRHALILIPVVLIAFWPYLPRGYAGLGGDLVALARGEAVWQPTWRIFDGLSYFAARYDSNGGLHRAALWLTGEAMARDPAARSIMGALFVALVVGMWLRGADLVTAGLFTIGGAVALGRVVHPWYACWLVPWLALALARGRPRDRLSTAAWLWFTGTVSVSYLVLIDYVPTVHDPYPRWQVPAWVMWLEYAPLVLILAVDAVLRATGLPARLARAGRAGGPNERPCT